MSDFPSRRGGSTGTPRESGIRRAYPSMDAEEEETRSQTGSQSLSYFVYQLECATRELRDGTEHGRDKRLDLQGLVKRISSERERDRSQLAFTQL